MAKDVRVIKVPKAVETPSERNDALHAWLGGTGNDRDVRSISWAKETEQWVVVTVRDSNSN